MTEGRKRIFFVGIHCDRCGRQRAGDYAASSQGAAEAGLRADLVADRGWRCDPSGDWCERCKGDAPMPEAEPVAVPSTEAPASRVTGPAEVEALHAIDAIIGNAETLTAEELGRVRRIVLDTLGAWHAAHPAAPGAELDRQFAGLKAMRQAGQDAGLWA